MQRKRKELRKTDGSREGFHKGTPCFRDMETQGSALWSRVNSYRHSTSNNHPPFSAQFKSKFLVSSEDVGYTQFLQRRRLGVIKIELFFNYYSVIVTTLDSTAGLSGCM
jgi:hypothetical protein